MHGQDGGNSSDSDSDDEQSAEEDAQHAQGSGSGGEESSSDGEEAEVAEAADGDADDDLRPMTRLQDLSEDDFEEESEDEELQQLKQDWMQEAAEKVHKKGRALRCVVCPKALILNAASLRQHLESKKHKAHVKELPEDDRDNTICFALDVEKAESDGETHLERLERIRRQVDAQEAVPPPAASRKRKKGEKQREPRKRPGKRQRALLKLQPGDNDKSGDKPRRKPTRKQQKANPSAKPVEAGTAAV
ncbi:hypothetical protein WJX72_002991 [[Myrmecia] bisecta]|uniref:Uncharacterized protein n=1 Tax=[Myrmecia] bisecta TaxID=41462 RepID=A0AAW1PSL0_9CHLO